MISVAKMSKLTKESVLTSGNMKMPIVGLGTYQVNDDGNSGEEVVAAALEAGYKHIDTAYDYRNESIIGKSLKKLFSQGKYKREDLFIVTKLPPTGNRPEHVEEFLKLSLAALQMDYVDLYLIHWPAGVKYTTEPFCPVDSSGNVLIDKETDIVAVWKAMEKQVDAGRAKAIGLSNFNINQISRILKEARIHPANLQVELHLYFQQKELRDFCKANNITMCAYAPLGSPGLKEFRDEWKLEHGVYYSPLTDSHVLKIAEKHNKTAAQILLRFINQLGVAVIPKSSQPSRIKSNIDLFDFELTQDEMNQLIALDLGEKGRMFGGNVEKGMDKHPETPF